MGMGHEQEGFVMLEADNRKKRNVTKSLVALPGT